MTHDPQASTQGGGASPSSPWVEGTTPYPWPFDGHLEPGRLALLVVGTREPVPQLAVDESTLTAIQALRAAAARFGAEVVDVTTGDPSGRVASPASPDSAVSPEPVTAFASPGWDGFFGTGLDAHLRRLGITHLLLTGSPLETAVHSTMRSANDRGYECLLVVDATAALDPKMLPQTLSMIEMSGGIFGANGLTAAVLARLAA